MRISAISPRVIPFLFADSRWYLNDESVSPWDIRDTTVTSDLSRSDSLSSLDHTSPNSTSSFSSANFGAKSPSESLPAVCFTILHHPPSRAH